MAGWGVNGLGLKAAALSAVLVVSVSAAGQDELDRLRAQMEAMQAQSILPQSLQPASDGAIASAIAQWTAVRQTDSLPFETYASFLLAHPGWPGESNTRRAAEKAAAAGEPMRVAAYFRRFPPQTATGAANQARALFAIGSTAEAAAAARRAWRLGTLSVLDETFVLSLPGALTPEDHDARLDMLLWSGQTSAAARLIGYASPARHDLLSRRGWRCAPMRPRRRSSRHRARRPMLATRASLPIEPCGCAPAAPRRPRAVGWRVPAR